MSDDSLDPLFYMIRLVVRLDVVVPKTNSQVLYVKLAHTERKKVILNRRISLRNVL